MICTKMAFASRKDADQYIKQGRRFGTGSKHLSAYHCKACGMYHLTSATRAKRRHAIRCLITINRKRQAGIID